MGLFSRRKKKDAPTQSETREQTDAIESADTIERDDAATSGAENDAAADAVPNDQDDSTTAAETPDDDERDHLDEGPFDVADAPELDRIDLGGLQIPMVDGMELRIETDQRRQEATGVSLVLGGSSLQLQAFAAPKSRGLWDEVRAALRTSVIEQGGTAETRPGPFGTELLTRLPLKRADGRPGYRPARFIGIDGPRWFVRAILAGKALSAPEQAKLFERILSQVVVVRGGDAMAPQELIPLTLPGQRPGLVPKDGPILDPLERGPEITEIG